MTRSPSEGTPAASVEGTTPPSIALIERMVDMFASLNARIAELESALREAQEDTRRLDWMTAGNHSVMCYAPGRWQCEFSASSPRETIDIEMAREALDAAAGSTT